MVFVQGLTGATGYNGSFIVTAATSTTIQYTATVSGTPTTNGSSWASIYFSMTLTDASGNNPTQGSAFSAQIAVQGGTPPYTYSFYASPQATTSSSTGYTGTWNGSTYVVGYNSWAINSSTGVVTGTPGVSENDILYVRVTDSASNTINSLFIVGVMPTGVGNGTYATGSLRQAIFGSIPSYISSTPSGLTAAGLTGPNTTATGYSSTPVTPNKTGLANSVTIQNTTPGAADGGYTNGIQYTCTKSNCLYTLQCNITSPTWALNIQADNVVINLNGYTITYMTSNIAVTSQYNDTQAFGVGSNSAAYSRSYTYVEIINGIIQNGAGKTISAVGGYDGCNCCPITFIGESNIPSCLLELRNLYIKWNVYSASGINLHGFYIDNTNSLIENCTFEDYGWNVANRQFPPAHTNFSEYFGIVRNNRFIAARQVAVGPAQTVYGNEIWQDGWWTNSEGINVEGNGQQIYNNNVYMTGNHPQSLFIGAANSSSTPCNAYGNWVEAMYTRVAAIFQNSTNIPSDALDDYENYADGVTMRFHQPQYINIYGNTLLTHAKTATVWNPKTGAYQNSTARGFWYNAANSTLANTVYGNTIAAISLDTSANCYAVAASGNGNGLTFGGTSGGTLNRIITNRTHFFMADGYGYYEGLTNSPIVEGNSIEIQSALGSGYSTFVNGAERSPITGCVITNASISGSTATLTYTSANYIGAGSTITVSGVTIDTNYNGVYTAITAGSGTLTYTPTITPTASGASSGSLQGTVTVAVTFQNNTWVHGSWTGSTTPSTFGITGTSGGASGTTPVIYASLGPNMTYSFVSEPGTVIV